MSSGGSGSCERWLTNTSEEAQQSGRLSASVNGFLVALIKVVSRPLGGLGFGRIESNVRSPRRSRRACSLSENTGLMFIKYLRAVRHFQSCLLHIRRNAVAHSLLAIALPECMKGVPCIKCVEAVGKG